MIHAGATTVNIPDTVGICLPQEFGSLIHDIRYHIDNDVHLHSDSDSDSDNDSESESGSDVRAKSVVISVHCQNDLGLSTANSLSGVQNGAR